MFRVVEVGRMVGIPMVMTSEEVERLDWNLEREKSEQMYVCQWEL